MRILDYVTHGAGPLYTLSSAALGCYVLTLFQPYMDNDYFWTKFTSASTSHVVVPIVNSQLLVGPSAPSLDMLASMLAPSEMLNQMSSVHPRLLMYQDLTAVEAGIAGLRRLDLSLMTFLPTKYCWADLHGRWEMGATTGNQARCVARDFNNGAVYLEAVLRNIDLTTWWQQNQQRFNVRVINPISSTPEGPAWVAGLRNHVLESVSDEASTWRRHNITYFQLLYSNHFQIGLQETIQVKNAFGMITSMTIKSIPSVQRGISCWTTTILTGSLEFDLQGPGPGQSLVRNTANFYGDFATQVEGYIIGSILSPVNTVVHHQLGVLCDIRTRWLPAPASLVAIAQSFRHTVLSALQSTTAFQAAFDALAPVTLTPTPPQWQLPNLDFYGGNPMCGYGNPLPYVQQSWGFDDVCSSQPPLTYTWADFNAIFALALLGATSTDAVCSLVAPSLAAICHAAVQPSLNAYKLLPAQTWTLPSDIPTLQVSIMQFVANASGISIQEQLIVDPVWAPYGYLSLYEWAMNSREVVSFEGDYRTMHLMSYTAPPGPSFTTTATSSLSTYMWYSSVVSAVVLAVLAVVLLLLALVNYKFTEKEASPPLWFAFNRIVGSVWFSRSLLLVRALTAIACLASAVVVPVTRGGTTQLTSEPRPFWLSCILAGETLWLSYVLQELLQPVTGSFTRLYAPLGALLTWIAVVICDVAAPPTLSASINRACFSINMDCMVYCDSGVIEIGSFIRTLWICGLQVLGSLVAMVVMVIISKYSQSSSHCEGHSMLLPPMAVAFLMSPTMSIDHITGAMCGFFHFNRKGEPFIFDVKLWLTLPSQTYGFDHLDNRLSLRSPGTTRLMQVVPSNPSLATDPSPIAANRLGSASKLEKLLTKLSPVIILAGCVYLAATLVGNVAYLTIAQAYMANDMFWANFNATGGYPFLANLFNQQLLGMTRGASLTFDTPAFGDLSQPYNLSVTTISWSANAARRALHDPNVASLPAVITGLRQMNPCNLPWMFTQYCWLDFSQNWEMASTSARQQRCKSTVAANGAVYLESGLRNLNNWQTFQSCWGTSFQNAIAKPLAGFTTGKTWLTATQEIRTPIDQEVAYWTANGITSFQLQWQNYKTIGFSDSILVENALGFKYALPLSQSPASFHPTRQTSNEMYWSFAADLWAADPNTTNSAMAGSSLLRGSTNFAFANLSSENLLFANQTLLTPLPPGYFRLRDALGPFNAIDMYYISCPPSALGLFNTLTQSVTQLTIENPIAQATFLTLPIKYFVLEAPSTWLTQPNILDIGGNIFCANDNTSSPFAYGSGAGFGENNFCNSVFLEYMQPTSMQVLFALLGFDTILTLNPSDFTAICASDDMIDASCPANYATVAAFLTTYSSTFASLRPLASTMYRDVLPLNVTFLQYVQVTGPTPSVQLYTINLLEPRDRPWNFYGWLMLFEWANGMREVVSFQGDAGTITTISEATAPFQMAPDPSVITQTFSYFFEQCLLYISVVLIAVAGVVMLYTLHIHGRIEGLNLFELNRVVGMVWIGRTFLVIRSITAICLLNTSTLQLTQIGRGTQFVSPQLPWYKSILASAEVTWFVYVLNDLFSCLTRQYTSYYATKSAVATWGATFIWTQTSPQRYIATIDRICSFVDMDSALVCSSGFVQIGNRNRVAIAFAICIACVVVCFVAERLVRPGIPTLAIPTMVLNAQSFYILDLTRWVHHDLYYLDRASAAMAGVVSLRHKNMLYVLDIKTWRVAALPAVTVGSKTEEQSKRWNQCVPLNDL
ncbi:Aste57867_9554 [Aphanomyces stellatus]|uniref:Aste57867_9554 protein n=1 Tax=Aphanomyces stellatus TaxID=120398 RepID=A0A485KNG7_9STRA|nr:hypothetical protein As57867_009517 [Aphanomyces stellatus]VFT86433.1 Aste57867_9554 [Aphanomyces stellatus]